MRYCIIELASGHIENIIEWDGDDPYDLPETHEMREWEPGDEIYNPNPPEPEPEE